MTEEQFMKFAKRLGEGIDWDSVPAVQSFEEWCAGYIPDKRVRDRFIRRVTGKAQFEIAAERFNIPVSRVVFSSLAQMFNFGLFLVNGEVVTFTELPIDEFEAKVNYYLHSPDFLRFLLDCYAGTEEAQKHHQEIIILQKRIAELEDTIKAGRFAL